LPGLSRNNDSAPVLTSFLRFRHVIEWFTFVRLLVTYLIQFLPDLFLPCSRPELLTRAAEGDLRPAPVRRSRGASYPSSVVQLRTTPSSSSRSRARGVQSPAYLVLPSCRPSTARHSSTSYPMATPPRPAYRRTLRSPNPKCHSLGTPQVRI